MGEVKRRRPWEETPKVENNNFFSQFLNQLIICMVIGIGVLIAFNTKEGARWKNTMKQELSKNIDVQEIYTFIEETKETLTHYDK